MAKVHVEIHVSEVDGALLSTSVPIIVDVLKQNLQPSFCTDPADISVEMIKVLRGNAEDDPRVILVIVPEEISLVWGMIEDWMCDNKGPELLIAHLRVVNGVVTSIFRKGKVALRVHRPVPIITL